MLDIYVQWPVSLDTDTCPILNTCLYSNMSSKTGHWTQAQLIFPYYHFQIYLFNYINIRVLTSYALVSQESKHNFCIQPVHQLLHEHIIY